VALVATPAPTWRCSSAELGQYPPQVADALADALLVLDEREAHVAVPARPEADAGRGRHLGITNEPGRELERPHVGVRLGDRSPHEHRPLGPVEVPPDAVEPIAQHVTPALVDLVDH